MAAASVTVRAPPTASAAGPTVRAGVLRDRGAVRRDAVRAASWTTHGLAKVTGDVDVTAGESSGLLSVGGRLAAGRFRATGTLEVGGAVEVAADLSLDGLSRFSNAVHAGDLSSRGTLHADAALRVDRAFLATGAVEARSVSAGLFDLTGRAEVPGELGAVAIVRGRFRGDSRIGSIRGKRVELAGPSTALVPSLWRAVFGGGGSVRVDRIEADRVELSAVDVGFVRAREVVLGPAAHVTELEGTVVRRDRTSRVGPESRSPRPHGLSR